MRSYFIFRNKKCRIYAACDVSQTPIPEKIKRYVNNYHVHIVNIAEWENVENFKTDLKQIFSFLHCANDRNKIKDLIEHDIAFQELDEDAYDMIAEYAASPILKQIKKHYQKGGKVDMCKGLNDWMEEERLVGIERGIEQGIERGIEQGIEQGIEAFVQDKIEDGKQEDEIVSRLILRFHLDEGKAKDYYQKYGVK